MTTFDIVILSIFGPILWFALGGLSAYILVGDVAEMYFGYTFGPLNHLNGIPSDVTHEEYMERMRLNSRDKFLITCGGYVSFVFMLIYELFYGARQLKGYIKYIFDL